MIPTAKLRFVIRYEPTPIHILQQWWMPTRTFSDGYGYQTVELIGGEWRDVPIEKEQV
jgi:hypothetical protein